MLHDTLKEIESYIYIKCDTKIERKKIRNIEEMCKFRGV